MRKSNRIASKLIKDAVKSVQKRSKRARESTSSISELEEQPSLSMEQSTTKNPTRKKVKIEAKSAMNSEEKLVKSSSGGKKSKSQSSQARKSRKQYKVKQETYFGTKGLESTPIVAPTSFLTSSQGKKFIGAHVSISGSLCNAVYDAVEIGARAFALFLRSQRQWKSKPLEDKAAQSFREACACYGFSPSHILPHGIYLMNCGSPDEETLAKSREALVEELQRCEMLGLTLYNFHPGSTCGKISVDECLDRIAESINIAHSKTKNVVTVVENMSCQGNTIGGKFEELHGIIKRVNDKSRIGVCLDTCHTFAAGYDISNKEGYEKTMAQFESVVGFKYLKGVHLNDSKGDLGCHLDRHENIGKGKIGKEGFSFVMEDDRFDGIPMILETPCVSESTYSEEIKTLYSMVF